jgi:hypothetical protein
MSLGTGMHYRMQGAITSKLQYRIKREFQTIVSIGPASHCANVSNKRFKRVFQTSVSGKCFKRAFQAGVNAGEL